ncbi:polysaccharide biosynthesis/export family protein [Pseudothioclava arenosa]|uniref:Sugar ABC transporter substrate-binding protein n=1 Tax=Pseudothioclava arenosa TaxID=1795308 RepID=A0A2A4CPZ4_9RHOB|nr:polysaccharide biosynthesis/export family protein [Pseudothioclava arenosa]PCD76209.1 sugar ABC transporter substrate-binding protein [Pseudothioclava arenosa]
MTNRRAVLAGLTAALMGTASCGLPRSGPSKREIYAGSVTKKGNAFVVAVDDAVARATAQQPSLGFSSALRNAGVVGSDTIHPGDTLGLTIWENVDDGLLASQGANATALTEMQVDGAGYIFVPYAGRIKAAGNSPDALRRIITEKLDPQTPDPQVMVTRMAGDGATVSIMGSIGGQGVYAIERPTRTLSTMIARAGGVSIKPEVAKITVKRGAHSEMIWLKDLYTNPQMDIALRAGDVVLIEEDTRAFTSLGATGAQARVPFKTPTLSALEALATVGGLQTHLADPTGIFVFRDETAEIASAVLGRNDLVGDQRLIYVLDLTEPNGLFIARDFFIRDGDTVYVTEAPYVQWQKTLGVLTGAIGTASTVSNATGN